MTFENQFELEIRAFFFNADTDYLPYYKNFSFVIDKTKDITLKEILQMIKEKNRSFSYPEKDLLFRVNDLVVTGDEKLSTVVDRLGTKLVIDPVLEYRSDNGLVINNHDFMHQFRRVLGHYASKEDLEYYLKLYPVHYASETFNYDREYIGDAILILAHKMIQDGNPHKEQILQAINGEFDGILCCEYENNLFDGTDYTDTINELKSMVTMPPLNNDICETIVKFIMPKKSKSYDINSLENEAVALYIGDKTDIKVDGVELVEFDMSHKLAGQTILSSNPTLAYKKAGKMLLDALDSGATILAFAKDEDLEIFSSIHSDVERAVGRDIELKLISLAKLKELIQPVEA
ncbi:MAG: hypothetical protein GXO60_02330 [Epsilonproteobacteria bacterium]|nr:hypothetical protein [Campylobacterota bacterium]